MRSLCLRRASSDDVRRGPRVRDHLGPRRHRQLEIALHRRGCPIRLARIRGVPVYARFR